MRTGVVPAHPAIMRRWRGNEKGRGREECAHGHHSWHELDALKRAHLSPDTCVRGGPSAPSRWPRSQADLPYAPRQHTTVLLKWTSLLPPEKYYRAK